MDTQPAQTQNSKVVDPIDNKLADLVPVNAGGDIPGLVEKSRDFLSAKSGTVTPPPAPTGNSSASVRGMTSLLDALFTKGLINEDDLKGIKFESVTSNRSIEDIILERHLVNEDNLQRTKAEMRGIGFVDLSGLDI